MAKKKVLSEKCGSIDSVKELVLLMRKELVREISLPDGTHVKMFEPYAEQFYAKGIDPEQKTGAEDMTDLDILLMSSRE